MPYFSMKFTEFIVVLFSTGIVIGGEALNLPLSRAKISFGDFVRKAATSPRRNAVVTLIISSSDFGMLSCRRLMSLGLVIPCMNPKILMHSGGPFNMPTLSFKSLHEIFCGLPFSMLDAMNLYWILDALLLLKVARNAFFKSS
ncbi:hypothetical protein Tco_1153871 [Tanacetum coccineum]